MPTTTDNLTFRVKPRLLRLLGDQLIRDANLAVFELVKNAYDADATKCSVKLEHPDSPSRARIEIEDNGVGMDENILRNAWMVIATDFRAAQRASNFHTPRFKRFPLGEKGLGRLSVHKLGHFIRLITRVKGGEELVVEFDWDRLENAEDLRHANVKLKRRDPMTFPGSQHGTKLEVSRLREAWARGEVRRLHRAVNSLCSPFKGPTDFEVTLSTLGSEHWLEDMFTSEKADECAIYRVKGWFEGKAASFDYEFNPPAELRNQITPRKEKGLTCPLMKREKGKRKQIEVDLSKFAIGRVTFEFLLFDRDREVLKATTDDLSGLKRYLDENGGVRIYRDGIRVYDFGEPGNDWLNLDIRRVNTPAARTSNNQILGALRLEATDSGDLREKSNREGFLETPAYADFRDAVTSVLTNVEAEKGKDQKRLREILGKGTGQKLFTKLTELRGALEDRGVLAEVETKLEAVEQEFEIYRDQLLHAAVPGLSLGIMLHGAEKILDELRTATRKGAEADRIKELVDRLYRAMRPVTNLLKNPAVAKTSASVLIKEAVFSTELRLKRHGIELSDGTKDDCEDFQVEGSKQMLVASITNLIDNAIHWLEVKNPKKKRLLISTTKDLEGGPAIFVADNGPGFGNDDPEDLITPFFTRRNGGMGLGLYIVNEVMRTNKGKLVFPDSGDIELPVGFDGAVVALQFLQSS